MATTSGPRVLRTTSASCSRPIAKCSSPSTAAPVGIKPQAKRRHLAQQHPDRRLAAGQRILLIEAQTLKLLLAQTEVGKLTPASIRDIALKRQDIHYPKPRVVTLTQATEVGTVYRPDELKAISATCKELGLHLHMDGARFSNACAFLGCSPAELSWKAGVDVLCFGGTKNGMAVGEAILFFNRDLAEDFDYRCKQAGQLASKMRFLAAPWVGVLQDDAWLRYADHANRCARLLAELVADVPGVSLMFPVEANGVFLQLSEPAIEALRARGWRFYTFIGEGGARFMCSWDTDIERVRELARDIRLVMGA